MVMMLGTEDWRQSVVTRPAVHERILWFSIWFLWPVLLGAQQPGVALPSNLVSWWQAESNALDIIRGNDGLPASDVAYARGEVGQAFRFAGNSGNCVRIPYAASLGSPTYTIEAWVNPVVPINDPVGQKVVFAQNTGRVQLLLRPGINGAQVLFGFRSQDDSWKLVTSSTDIPLAQFSYVAATWDGKTQRLYVNGKLCAQAIPSALPLDSGCDFFIGGIASSTGGAGCQYVGQFFQGLIDEVRYYRRALAATEIQAIYSTGGQGMAAPVRPGTPLASTSTAPARFALDLQRRDPASGLPYLKRQVFSGSQLAILVMDVWNSHPDPEMASRGSALIPRINEALAAARALGITVIFCPNEVPAPAGANTTVFARLANRAYVDNGFNPPLPSYTDSSIGDMVPIGYDSVYAPRFTTYTGQHPDLVVAPGDLASISRQQIYNYCAAHGITHLLYMGVAANMCVCCTRETSMIPMKRFCGLEPILVRDLTDSMTLNGRKRTGVNESAANVDLTMTPDRGHRLVVAQDETYVCSSIDARQLLQYWTPAAYANLISGEPNLLCFWQMNSKADYQEIPDTRRTQSCWWNRDDIKQIAGLGFTASGAIADDSDTAVRFNGSTVLVSPLFREDIPANSPLVSLSATNFTLETWIRPVALNSNQWFFSHDNGTAGGVDVLLGLNSSNRFQFVVGKTIGLGAFGDSVESDSSLTQSDVESRRWFHLVAVHDVEHATVSLYINGELAVQTGHNCAPVSLTTAPHFGSRGVAKLGGSRYLTQSGFEFFYGAVDEFAIYSAALGSNTVSRHYQVGIGQSAPPISITARNDQNQLLIKWPAWPLGLRLETSEDLRNWRDAGPPVQEINGTRQVSLPMVGAARFFRPALP